MTVTIAKEGVKNGFGRNIKPGTVIEVSDSRAKELIDSKQAYETGFFLKNYYQNQVNKMKSEKERADQPPPDTRQRSWFGRLFGD